MIDDIFVAPFREFAFMRRALMGCVALALGAAPVGVFLMLRRMSLTGDAMAHAILPGAAIGFLLAGLSMEAMTLGGIVAGLVVALLSGTVARSTMLREDASLAAFYLISLALGVVIVSVRGTSVDLIHVLFGSVLALDDASLTLIAGIATVSLLVMAALYRVLVMECVDPGFLRSVSRLSPLAHYAFLGLVVINLVGAFNALGTLMAVGIMVLPAAGARFWTRSIDAMLLVAVGIALLSGVTGLLGSYHFELPAGPSVVLAAGSIYLLSLVLGRDGIITRRILAMRHLEA